MRKRSLAQWKKVSWKAFSRYIRQRDEGRCFTCGVKRDPKEMDAGHYIAGSICGLVLYFSEVNVNCQCTRCNRFLHGNLAQYALALKKKHGDKILEDLDRIRLETKGTVFTEKDYQRVLKEYGN